MFVTGKWVEIEEYSHKVKTYRRTLLGKLSAVINWRHLKPFQTAGDLINRVAAFKAAKKWNAMFPHPFDRLPHVRRSKAATTLKAAGWHVPGNGMYWRDAEEKQEQKVEYLKSIGYM